MNPTKTGRFLNWGIINTLLNEIRTIINNKILDETDYN